MASKPQVIHLHKAVESKESTQRNTTQLLARVLRPPVEKAIHLTRKKEFCYQDFARSVEIILKLIDYLPDLHRPKDFKLIVQQKPEELLFQDLAALENFARQSKLQPVKESIPGEIAIARANKVDRLMAEIMPLIEGALDGLAARKRKRAPSPSAQIELEFRNGSLFRKSTTKSEQDDIYMQQHR